MANFPGFPAAAFEFLSGLEANNEREWFQARKDVFESQVKAPMEAFVTALNAEIAKFAPALVTEPKKAVYRIYRDTRFSNDKTPYKTHVAAIFTHPALGKHAGGGFYTHVSAKGAVVAGGVYMPGPEDLYTLRTHLAGRHAEFEKLCSAKALKSTMGELQGSQLSRVPKGFPADHPAADLLRRKQWFFGADLDASIQTTPELFKEVRKRFAAMAPLIEFMNEPLLAAQKKAARVFA